jgi:hypothetical protein
MDEVSLDYGKIIRETNGRITVPDLELLWRVGELIKPERILEIGSADGGSSIVLGTIAKANGGKLYCIEPNPRPRMAGNMKAYGLDDSYYMIRGKSPWIASGVVPPPIDLLFIDGCHYCRWCLVDYHYWSPSVRLGGAIVFHDTGGTCQEDRRTPGYGKPGYAPHVVRAIEIIFETDRGKLESIGESVAHNGGAAAFRKIAE